MDPDGFTLRAILLMANARMRHDWNRSADLMALTANINKRKESRALGRADFHPMINKTQTRRAGIRLTPEVLRARRAMFTNK